ncbi:hypothetical protein [Peribacillus sp. SCS-155]|uniref:hypothetical protein n=1 Tax=Peribacillus sedimenti TaxID=3115297 RepID=UPI0039065E3C
MDLGTVRKLFEWYDAERLFERLEYKFYVSGLFDDMDDPDVLCYFLEQYSFNEETCLFDEFSFHFKIFQYMHRNND